MKIKTVFLVIFLTLLNLSSIFAAPVTAPPAPMSANGVVAPNPPTSDINQNIVLLLVCALIFGMHTIYKYNLKKKASI